MIFFLFIILCISVTNKFIAGKYVGNRPIKLRKSKWKERTDVEALERQKVSFLSHTKICRYEFVAFHVIFIFYNRSFTLISELPSKEAQTVEEKCTAQVKQWVPQGFDYFGKPSVSCCLLLLVLVLSSFFFNCCIL